MKWNGQVSLKQGKRTGGQTEGGKMFLNHSFVPWSMVSFNE